MSEPTVPTPPSKTPPFPEKFCDELKGSPYDVHELYYARDIDAVKDWWLKADRNMIYQMFAEEYKKPNFPKKTDFADWLIKRIFMEADQ